MTLFFTNYEYNPMIYRPNASELLSLTITENAKRLRLLHIQLAQDAEFINKTISKYYNKRHIDVLPWKEGNKVYLQRKNI